MSNSVSLSSAIQPRPRQYQTPPSTDLPLHPHREQFQDTLILTPQKTSGEEAIAAVVQEVDPAVEGAVPNDREHIVARACIVLTAGPVRGAPHRSATPLLLCQRTMFRQGGCQFMNDDTSYEFWFSLVFRMFAFFSSHLDYLCISSHLRCIVVSYLSRQIYA